MKTFHPGLFDPSSLIFYSQVSNSLSQISTEFFSDTLDLSLLKQRLGFNSNWFNSYTETDDISQPVEDWIRSGGFHEEQIGYDSRDGEWKTFPLWKRDQPELASTMRQFLPSTIEILEAIPNLYFASIFKQPPNSKVARHKHTLKHCIAHFLLNDLEDGYASIEVNDKKQILKYKGDCVAFDYTYPHSSSNASNTDRVNLVIDIVL
tara:strand:- start:6298 stop:6915 length:618 start_codon:yes stop_codon:yes gene_type:complete